VSGADDLADLTWQGPHVCTREELAELLESLKIRLARSDVVAGWLSTIGATLPVVILTRSSGERRACVTSRVARRFYEERAALREDVEALERLLQEGQP
jgi:hypothetical protein